MAEIVNLRRARKARARVEAAAAAAENRRAHGASKAERAEINRAVAETNRAVRRHEAGRLEEE